MTTEMKITCISPWFGSKRTLAPVIVEELGRHSYYFEGCCGSMAVLFAKEPSEHETVCDLHGALTNLAWVLQDQLAAQTLFERLQRTLYSDALYRRSNEWLERNDGKPVEEMGADAGLQTICQPNGHASIAWAYHYFIASWMGRNGIAGTARINYQIATRWTPGGGSGPLRFRNAVDSIPAWCDRLRNVHILRRDLFDVLPRIEDNPAAGIYVDPPYLPGTVAGNSKYVHEFADPDHARLAAALRRFVKARVVVSYYASPQLADLYPGWTILDCSRHKHLATQNARGTKRTEAPEVLLLNGSSFTGKRAADLFT